ncbi:MAG: hypothetical protein WBV85_04570 [Solirubrobacteraceae bacterium]
MPDGRVYEEATPPDKHGTGPEEGGVWGLVSTDGQAVMYRAGPLAEDSANGNAATIFVSRRTSSGWVARSAIPIGAPGTHQPEENNGVFVGQPYWFLPSSDLSHLAFSNLEAAEVGPPDTRHSLNNFYLAGPDPFVEPIWVARNRIEGAPLEEANEEPYVFPAGGSADLSTIYFTYPLGPLLPEEAGKSVSDFYEWRDGVLSDAGVLPGGAESPSGATPAAQQDGLGLIPVAEFSNNQVSTDGSHAFFVRSDSTGTGELYVHVTASDGTQSSLLVSQSQLPGHVGEPAPDGPVAVPSTLSLLGGGGSREAPPWYVFATPDASHAFFESVDRLTSSAPETGAPKMYDFDLLSGQLEYLPGVSGSIVTVSHDGSSFVFENTASSPFELDRWTAGPNGGMVTPIAQLSAPNGNCGGNTVCVGPAQTSTDGSVVVFNTESPIAGFNDKGGFLQVFRYDAETNQLTCASCPPAGIVPSGPAAMSKINQTLNRLYTIGEGDSAVDTRAVSTDGNRIFFDTPDPLVSRDTDGTVDTYEWENGSVFLISSGASGFPSSFLGIGESGGDTYFTSKAGLVSADNDGVLDVYDARVPQPGDNPPPSAVPCQGDVCQGQPSVPQLLGAPPSAMFNGVGNAVPPVEARPSVKTKVKHKPKRRRRHKGKGKKAARSHGAANKSDRRGK